MAVPCVRHSEAQPKDPFCVRKGPSSLFPQDDTMVCFSFEEYRLNKLIFFKNIYINHSS